MKTALLELL